MTLNWLDIVMLMIVLWSASAGLRAGLARVVIGLIAALVGLLAGFWCYRLVAARILPWVATETIANLAAFAAIFLFTLVIGSLLASLISSLFKWVGLSWFNHLLGGVAGIMRGALIICALLDFIVAFSPSPTPAVIEQSRVLPYASRLSSWLVQLAPRDLKDAFDQQLENLRHLWSRPADRHTREA